MSFCSLFYGRHTCVRRPWNALYGGRGTHRTTAAPPRRYSVSAQALCHYVFIILQLSNTKKASSVWWKLSACLDIVFLFCYLLYLKTLLRLRHTFFFNLKEFCSSFFILLRFLCKGVAFSFKSFLLVPLFSVLLTSYRPNLHQQRGGRLVRMPFAFLQ